ncbi:MAG TPA: hypothetical protein VMW23_02695 [Sedimentisphaerales bacterium]|nr:hypothetical protein [Sedimentisphaerales bacterium]
MRLGIIGAIAMGLGILAMVYCRWFIIEIIEGLIALILVLGGALAIAVALRRMGKEKASAKEK